jgi:hypothetical protein
MVAYCCIVESIESPIGGCAQTRAVRPGREATAICLALISRPIHCSIPTIPIDSDVAERAFAGTIAQLLNSAISRFIVESIAPVIKPIAREVVELFVKAIIEETVLTISETIESAGFSVTRAKTRIGAARPVCQPPAIGVDSLARLIISL